jgi:ferric-dicitrate binding protein FerR (iron transport regulator)
VGDYYHFSVNDFVMDEFFQAWVWHPTEENNQFWRSWLALHPDKAQMVEEARGILKKLNFPKYALSEKEVGEIWNKVKNSDVYEQTVPLKTSSSYWWYSAASVAAILCVIFFFQIQKTNRVVIQTTFGETKSIVLPDSTTVILNANSKIAFADDWENQPVREVWLEGEAFFEVKHLQDDQPFKVKVDDGVAVEVLGTSFNVYHRTEETKVVLNSGQIRLSVPTDTKLEEKIMMKPGDMVEVKSKKYNKRSVDANLYVAWTHNKLILDYTSLGEIIQMLEDNYGVKVVVDHPGLLSQTVSGSMPMPEAERSVELIAKAFQLTVTKENDTYRLKE